MCVPLGVGVGESRGKGDKSQHFISLDTIAMILAANEEIRKLRIIFLGLNTRLQ